MTRRLKEQRTLLTPNDVPSAAFVQDFKVSHNFAKAMSMERKSSAPGQMEYSRKKALQNVEEARRRPKPPLPSLIEQQELLSALRRDAPTVLQPAEEAPERRARRDAKRKAFLDSRRDKHDEAMLNFERSLDSLAERCQVSAKEASERMLCQIKAKDKEIDELLALFEGDVENLGEKTEEEVHEIMGELEHIIETRRGEIEEFTRGLQETDCRRREQSEAFMKDLVADLSEAAHVVPGEIERVIEQKALDLNTALLENDKSVKTLNAKLSMQTLEKSKDNKVRWHKGLMLWKQKRHRYALGQVMARIRSPEFREPPEALEVLDRIRKRQREVYKDRMEIIEDLASAKLKELSLNRVRSMEETNAALNDRVQESWDSFIIELRELKDGVDVKAQGMLGALCQELEEHDARQEWGDHESALDIVNAEVRPHLAERQKGLEHQIDNVIETLSNQDEKQNSVVVRMVGLYMSLAKKQEILDSNVKRFESNYEGDVDDCKHAFEESCMEREEELRSIKESIADAADFEKLKEFKEKAFQLLDNMGAYYREHADQLLTFHSEYKGNVAKFMQKETAEFCNDLGLVTEAQWQLENPVDPDAPDAGAAPHLPEWAIGKNVGLTVLEKLDLPQLRERTLQAVDGGIATDDDDTFVVDPSAASRPPTRGGDGVDEGKLEFELPTLMDGRSAIEMLEFEPRWVEQRLARARQTVFEELAVRRVYMDRVDVASRCEEAKRDRDVRLRQHTNRKGEVQVDCCMPRYAIIDTHKKKFDRHKAFVQARFESDGSEFDQVFDDLGAQEEAYQARFAALQAKLDEARSLPDLVILHRQGLDAAEEFKATCDSCHKRLEDLATTAIAKLTAENEDFLASCEPDTTCSKSEMAQYSKAIGDMNKQLEAERVAREERVEQLVREKKAKRTGPLDAFLEQHSECHKALCKKKGLGRNEGAKRREAQGACRVLIARGVMLRENLLTLLSFLKTLCEQPVDASEAAMVPVCELFPFRQFLSQVDFGSDGTKQGWTFTAELVSLLYVIVCILNFTALHLDALDQNFASRYRLENMPRVSFFDERKPLCVPTEEQLAEEKEQGQQLGHEATFRRACLQATVGQLLTSETFDATMTFDATIQGIKTSLEQHYNDKEGGLPEFITSFLLDERKGLLPSADRARKEAAIVIREQCDSLRGETLLQLGDVLFGELTARSLRLLRAKADEVRGQNASQWRSLDNQRASHEGCLGPGLANPKAEAKLGELIASEKARYKAGQKLLKAERLALCERIREQIDIYIHCLAARFEVGMRLIDAIPLHGHFVALPGDEHVEPPRVSIKRRMRRMMAGAPVDTGNDKLQERPWSGVPLHEFRKLLPPPEWPPDEKVAGATPETLEATTPEVDSFRSPVHRKLFERRTFYYNKYMESVTAEIDNINTKLRGRATKEECGKDNWVFSIRQLTGGETGGADDVEDPPPEEPPAEEPPPPAGKKR